MASKLPNTPSKMLWLEEDHHRAAKTLACLRRQTISDILSSALADHAKTLHGRELDIYTRALSGEHFHREELLLHARILKKELAEKIPT